MIGRANADLTAALGRAVDTEADLRRLKKQVRRGFWVRAIAPFSCGLVFGGLGSLVGHGAQTGDWQEAGVALGCAVLLLVVFLLRVAR